MVFSSQISRLGMVINGPLNITRLIPFRSFSIGSRLCQTATTTNENSPVFKLQDRNTTKHVLSRKTFLIDYYKHLNDNNDIVLYVHHNNLGKNDTNKVRTEFKKLGVKMTYLRNSLYQVYLRSAHEQDPPLHENTIKNKNVHHPLAPLLSGPTAIITVPKCDPPTVEQVLKVLKGQQEKLFLIGARVEAAVYDVDDVEKFKSLPSKDALQGQLAGLLTVLGGAGLVNTLQAPGSHLYLTLDQRRKDQE